MGLEQRLRLEESSDRRAAGGREGRRAAVQHGLGRAQAHDDVGLEQRRVDPHRHRALDVDRDQLLGLAVVHDERSAEVTGLHRRQEPVELVAVRAPLEPARDQDRLVVGSDPGRLELVENCRERLSARVVGRTRER